MLSVATSIDALGGFVHRGSQTERARRQPVDRLVSLLFSIIGLRGSRLGTGLGKQKCWAAGADRYWRADRDHAPDGLTIDGPVKQ